MNVKHSNGQHLEKLPVNEMDLRAVEDWLGQMAGKGYFLDETAWSWWYFNIGEPANVRYRIEPNDEKNGKLDPQKKEDYETMGWKYVTSHKSMYHIFLAESEETEEFHTDPLVRNLALKGYEKKLRSLGISSIVAFSSFFVICYKTISREARGIGLFIANPFFLYYALGILLLIIFGYQNISAFRRIKKWREKLGSGEDEELPVETGKKKRYSSLTNHIVTILIVAVFASLFLTIGTGGPIHQEIQDRPLPVLQALETGTVEENPDKDGDVIYYFSLLLNERYEISQQASVREKETGESSVSLLKVDLYDARFNWLAELLYSDLEREHLSKYGEAYSRLSKEGYEHYSLMEDGENQILVAKMGKKVLVIDYQGKERLEEKAGVLERVTGTK